jgi:GTPase SAR1 family protein
MEPVTITLIVLSLLCTAGGGGIIWSNWEKILTAISGKRIAVIGARGAGKTTLLNCLDMINRKAIEIEQTRTVEKTRSSSINLNVGGQNTTIRLKDTIDLPGSEDYRNNGQWKGAVENSDIVLYIVHAAALLRGIDKSSSRQKEADKIKKETAVRVKDDLLNIQSWIKEVKEKGRSIPPIFIIGNHFDEIKENFSDSDNIEDCENEFTNNEVIHDYGMGMIKIIGSLKTNNTIKDILERVINEI